MKDYSIWLGEKCFFYHIGSPIIKYGNLLNKYYDDDWGRKNQKNFVLFWHCIYILSIQFPF